MIWFALALASNTALIAAAGTCNDKELAAAMEAGADLASEHRYHKPTSNFLNSLFPPKRRWTTALHEATFCALAGKPKLLKRLIDAGAPINLATVNRPPAVHLALHATYAGGRRGPEVTVTLLDAGADPYGRYRGHSAAHALYNSKESSPDRQALAAEALLLAGVHPTDLLCGAAAMGDLKAVTQFIESGLDPDGRCTDGTPLVAATLGRHAPVVQHLLTAGVSPNSHTPAGETWVAPLHVAVADGWVEGTRLLLEAEADPNASNGPLWAPGRPPLAVALSLKTPEARTELITMLVDAGASRALFAAPDAASLDAVGERPPSAEEAAVQRVRVVMATPEHPLKMALTQWGPQRLAALLIDEVPELPAVDRFACTVFPEVRAVRRTRTSRTDGHWAQYWSTPTGDTLVVRDRRPGQWTVLSAPGAVDTPCQSLVGRPSSHLLLTLGPPAHADASTIVYDVAGDTVVFTVAANVVTGWQVRARLEP